jgi:tubulin monoglycylase TTLL3/8
MFDEDFKVFLIEVNTNPCLELSSPLLARLIPSMVENTLRIVVDPLFPPPENWSQKKQVINEICPENKFELIFDSKIDGPVLTDLFKEKENVIIEIDEEELSDVDKAPAGKEDKEELDLEKEIDGN